MVEIFNHKFKVLFGLVILLLGIGTIFYHYVELFNWVDAFYFSAMTLTTVGYGDFFPKTNLGKIFTVAYIFIGLGVILAFVNFIAKQRIRRRLYEKASVENKTEELKVKLKKERKKFRNIQKK